MDGRAEERTDRYLKNRINWCVTLRCATPVVCVTNEREESVVNQHN